MSLEANILLWLVSLHWTPHDRAVETESERKPRLAIIAKGVAQVADGDRAKAAFLLVQGRHESDYDSAVQVCECSRYQCDPLKVGATIEFRAHGLWQVRQTFAHDIAWWWSACGTTMDAVLVGAKFTATKYRPSDLECSFAALGGVATCSDDWCKQRARETRALARRL